MPVHVLLGIKPRTSWVLDEYPTNWATSLSAAGFKSWLCVWWAMWLRTSSLNCSCFYSVTCEKCNNHIDLWSGWNTLIYKELYKVLTTATSVFSAQHSTHCRSVYLNIEDSSKGKYLFLIFEALRMAARRDSVVEPSRSPLTVIPPLGTLMSESFWCWRFLAPSKNWGWKFSVCEKHLEVWLDYKLHVSQLYDVAV